MTEEPIVASAKPAIAPGRDAATAEARPGGAGDDSVRLDGRPTTRPHHDTDDRRGRFGRPGNVARGDESLSHGDPGDR